MSTRAELEHAILTQPQSDARDAAYLDWLQEFAPDDLELARVGLRLADLPHTSQRSSHPVLSGRNDAGEEMWEIGRVEGHIEIFDPEVVATLRGDLLRKVAILRLGGVAMRARITAVSVNMPSYAPPSIRLAFVQV